MSRSRAPARQALAVAGFVLLASGAACTRRSAPPPPPAAPAPEVATAPAADAADSPAAPALEPEPDEPREPRPDAAPDTVKIKLVADQRAQAHVFWGRKELGVAPVEVIRPRGSGPLDLLVLADGYLPLHTRAFTDRSETLSLRLVPAAAAAGLPGYAPPPPDAGVARTKNPTNGKNPGTNPATKAKQERP
jgi:hypothetical protein